MNFVLQQVPFLYLCVTRFPRKFTSRLSYESRLSRGATWDVGPLCGPESVWPLRPVAGARLLGCPVAGSSGVSRPRCDNGKGVIYAGRLTGFTLCRLCHKRTYHTSHPRGIFFCLVRPEVYMFVSGVSSVLSLTFLVYRSRATTGSDPAPSEMLECGRNFREYFTRAFFSWNFLRPVLSVYFKWHVDRTKYRKL